MNFQELIIQIDFQDRTGLGYEIFEVCEKNGIDKIGMEVIPNQGMYIKLRVTKGNKDKFINDLKLIKGVLNISFCDHMPYEEREYNLTTILNAVSEGVVATDKRGLIIHINRVACEIFHCNKADVIGIRADELFGADPPIYEMLSTAQPYRLVERNIKRNNKAIRILTSGVPVINEKGQIFGAVATIKDFKEVQEILAKVDIKNKLTNFEDIIHISSKMRHLVETAKIVARGNSTILLRGESGTGKELFARAIHVESQRANAPFIAINCAALPETLLESELFGYEEGAFTGAIRGGKKGIFEQANKGTIFLDEIGEISQSVQVRLLRVIQEGVIRRVGGTKEIVVDVRIITATHRNLEEMINTGEFREDLYYRLNVIPLRIPPLRERKEDIPLIAQHLLKKICNKLNKNEVRLSKESINLLKAQYWQGNVRQLENILERVLTIVDEKEITPQHFYDWTELKISQEIIEEDTGKNFIKVPLDEKIPNLKDIVAQVEKQVLLKVLETYKSSRKAGQILGVSNTTILNKMKIYGIREQ